MPVPSLLSLCYQQHRQLIRCFLPTYPALHDSVFSFERQTFLYRRYAWRLAQGVMLQAIQTPQQLARLRSVPLIAARGLIVGNRTLPWTSNTYSKILVSRHTQIRTWFQFGYWKQERYYTIHVRGSLPQAIAQREAAPRLFETQQPWYYYLFLRQLHQEYEGL